WACSFLASRDAREARLERLEPILPVLARRASQLRSNACAGRSAGGCAELLVAFGRHFGAYKRARCRADHALLELARDPACRPWLQSELACHVEAGVSDRHVRVDPDFFVEVVLAPANDRVVGDVIGPDRDDAEVAGPELRVRPKRADEYRVVRPPPDRFRTPLALSEVGLERPEQLLPLLVCHHRGRLRPGL